MPKKLTETKNIERIKTPEVKNMFQAEKINLYSKAVLNLIKKISSAQVLVFLLIIAAFLIGVLVTKVQYLEKNQANNNTQATAQAAQQQTAAPAPVKVDIATIKNLFNNKDIIKFGDISRKNIIVEIADPSCPYCHVAAGLNSELNKQMGDQFVLVSDGGTYVAPVPEMRKLLDQGQAAFAYIYFPGHGNGEMAMKALYCANEQGKFWNAHDLLMTNTGYNLINNDVKNDKANAGKLVDYLAGVLDSQALSSCLQSGKYDSFLANDQKIASPIIMEGTPTFYVNAQGFNANNWNDMKSAVK